MNTTIRTQTLDATLTNDSGGLRTSVVFALIILIGFGFLYSLAGTGVGRALFPHQATGSLIENNGKVIGSSLVAQPFADARYFQPRPSAASYDPMAAAGSNQARSNPDMRKRVEDAIAAVALRDGIDADSVPNDLVTQSGGGLDPHVSPAGAQVQIARVAQARGIPVTTLEELVARHTEPKTLGVLGAARVNVLELNVALDAVR